MGNSKFAFTSLLLYCFGVHFITKMKYMPQGIVSYGLSLLLCLIFVSCLNNSNLKTTSKSASLWVPYVVITIIGCTIFGYFRLTALWIVAILILGISQNFSISQNLPVKIIYCLGLIQVVAEILQIVYPDLYNGIISAYFGNDFKMFGSGLQGFTEQTAVLASTLLLTMGALIYYKYIGKIWTTWVVIAVFVALIFMTGKRSFATMSIMIPLAVMALSQKNNSKTLLALSFSALLGMLFLSYFIENAEQLSDIPGLKKITETFSENQSEDDIINGREILWDAAIKGFYENPLFGIGTGRYMDWSGLPTNAHNAYLQVLCEQGILGFLLFVIPLIACLIQSVITLKKLPDGSNFESSLRYSLFIQLFFIMYAFTGNPTRNEYCFLMYFVAIGIMSNVQYKLKSQILKNYENIDMC